MANTGNQYASTRNATIKPLNEIEIIRYIRGLKRRGATKATVGHIAMAKKVPVSAVVGAVLASERLDYTVAATGGTSGRDSAKGWIVEIR